MCLNIGTPKHINFPFETNGNLMVLGVPILKLCLVSAALIGPVVGNYNLLIMKTYYKRYVGA